MRKFSLLLSTIVVLALLLAACGGQETTTSVPSTNVPPVTVESTGTEAPSATEAPTSAPGAGDLTTTPGVPVTGENNPSRASNMINMILKDQNNTEVGKVQDLVLDLDNKRVAYLVVQSGGVGAAGNKTVLVPWNSVQLQTSADSTASGQENAFVLLADPNFLSNAPDSDVSTLLPGMCQAAGNWDADIRNFWATGAMPSSTQSANTPSAGTGSTANATATSTTGGTGTNVTATSTSGGTGTSATATTTTGGMGTGNNGTGNNQGQGVVLASQVLGTPLMTGGQGQGQGQATAMPDTTATATTGGTGATATASTGGTGTGTGQSAGANQATVEDAIIDMATGDVQYLVISTAKDNTQWIPIPVGFLRCDSTTNRFSLTINANALQNAPAFAQDQFPDTSTTGWDTEFSTFWQNNGGTGTAGTGGTGTGVTSSTATATP
jgi:sporulation protein YlmC with PRC-barrel domain